MRAIERLNAALKDVNEVVRVEAASALEKLRIISLVDDLRSKGAHAAYQAVQQLRMFEDYGTNMAVKRLLDAIGDTTKRERYKSIHDSGQWRMGKAGPLLLELTKRILQSRGLLRY